MVRIQLEFGKYMSKDLQSKKRYVIQIITKAKYREPPMTEADTINNLSHHFNTGHNTRCKNTRGTYDIVGEHWKHKDPDIHTKAHC